jgi:3-hydroxyisobutyrate dehydrogenase
MVGFPRDVEEVYLGENGIIANASMGTLCLDFTTTKPSLASEIARLGAERGVACLDCPVSGGDVGARQATLSIMVGGEPTAFDRALPVLGILGKNIQYQGGPGSGQHCKMANQITIAGTMVGVCEALLYGVRAGLNPEALLSAIRPGAAGCWTLEHLAPRILNGRFEPGFMVDHFLKDMGIALEEAERMGLVLPGLSLVRQLYLATRNGGWGKMGTHALYLALQRLASAVVE